MTDAKTTVTPAATKKAPLLPLQQLPTVNTPVRAILGKLILVYLFIKHFNLWVTEEVNLYAVDEDEQTNQDLSNCTWRFSDDNCELDHSYNVVYWEYIDV